MSISLWGQPTVVNLVTSGVQSRPVIETLNNGNMIVVWRDDRESGNIYGRLYNQAGQSISGELSLATGASVQDLPDVAALASGGFVVGFEQAGAATYAVFGPNGNPVTSTTTLAGAKYPAVTRGPAADAFSTAWSSSQQIGYSRFDAAGTFINSQVISTVNTPYPEVDVARLSDGRFVAVWQDITGNIIARLINAGGTLGSVLDLTVASSGSVDSRPKITALQGGAFVVTWHGTGTDYPASTIDVRARIVDGTGNLVGSGEFIVNPRTLGDQTFPNIVALNDGGFLAVWHDTALRAQAFNAFGERSGSDIVVNAAGGVIAGLGTSATVLGDGRVAVVWHGFGIDSGDTNGGVYMQIIDPRDGYVEGTAFSETLYGHDAFEDLILARGGSDTVVALGGNDSIYAGDGSDTVAAGSGDDIVVGGDGLDFINGDIGDDLIYGDSGNDTVGAGAGIDLVFGGVGDDWLEGGAGDDTMLGEAGGDRLEGQDGNDVLDGGAGNDVMIGGAGNDIFYMDSLGDQVVEAAGGGTDIVYSSAGWLGNANVENLVLTGSAPLNATMNNDANLVAGNGAANVINGAGGNDTIDGLGGMDWLGGGDGGDRLDGGADNDTIQGGVGADSLYGGSGADSFYYGSYLDSNATQGIDSIQDFQVGIDKINLTPARLSATDSVSITLAYGNAYVFVDLYGDGINDMIIEVIGATTLSGSDLSFVPPAASAIYYGDDAEASQSIVTEAMAAAFRGSWAAVV